MGVRQQEAGGAGGAGEGSVKRKQGGSILHKVVVAGEGAGLHLRRALKTEKGFEQQGGSTDWLEAGE